MNVRNKAAWNMILQTSVSGDRVNVLQYATRWANIMEERLNVGGYLKDIAKTTSQEADYEGITGSMYDEAVAILCECWDYGEELREWHRDSENEMCHENEDGRILPMTPVLLAGRGKLFRAMSKRFSTKDIR